ncbi:hypothetical protein J4419_01875 [Candidatus Woesearchaeota archaeon]|nr:hypothetical protein [Candidatus Woesearchaeota archaeon]
MPRRERLDILEDMLAAIQRKGEMRPTHLMYKANLAHRQLKHYLDELVQKELVKRTERNGSEYLLITDSGNRFLEKLKEMRAFEETFGI